MAGQYIRVAATQDGLTQEPEYWSKTVIDPTYVEHVFYNLGNVGIGQAVPQSKLVVDGSASIGSTPYSSTAAPTDGLIVKGSVGIGTTNPTSALDVNGTIKATLFQGTISVSALSGTVPAANGGTGNNTYAIGDLLYASAATTLSRLADVATGNALISGGVGVAPSWGKIGLTTHVSGTLAVANGGTGAATLTASKVLVGNGTTAILQPTNLHWDNTNSRLGVQNTAPTAILHLGAGTATVPPIKLTTGPVLTTVGAGSVEYDGVAFYASPNAGYRGVVPNTTAHILNAARAFTNVATAQQIFATNINLIASTTYMFEMVINKARTASAGTTINAHTLNLSFTGTAVLTSISYNAVVSRSATDNSPNASTIVNYSTAASSVIGASFSGLNEYTDIIIKGVVRCGATPGTFIPNLTYSVAPITTPTAYADNVNIGSYINFFPVGSSTVTTVGNVWS